jgi:hypothetical protein
MANEMDRSVVVDFPLRGERWVAVNTPGDRIPSHGPTSWANVSPMTCSRSTRVVVSATTPLEFFAGSSSAYAPESATGWGAEIHAPFDGEIVRASDGVTERRWIHPLRELVLVLKKRRPHSAPTNCR